MIRIAPLAALLWLTACGLDGAPVPPSEAEGDRGPSSTLGAGPASPTEVEATPRRRTGGITLSGTAEAGIFRNTR